MKSRRLAANDLAELETALDAGVWRSKIDRELKALRKDDRLVFFCTLGRMRNDLIPADDCSRGFG